MRSIRTENEVDGDIEDAKREWTRLDDAWEMIEWVLMRDPTVGVPQTESGKARSFVFDGSVAHEMPTIQILYIFDDQFITIMKVKFSNPMQSAGTA